MANLVTNQYEEFEPNVVNDSDNDSALTMMQLEERKIIQRAKEILMRQRGLDEEQAYVMLREMAMRKKMKLSALATQLIDAAKMLIV